MRRILYNNDINNCEKVKNMGIEHLSKIWPEWKVIEQIGEGSFGKVYKIMRDEHGFTDYAAVKVISIPQSDAEINALNAEGYDELNSRTYFESIVTDFIGEIKLMVSMKGTANIVSVEDYKVLEKSDRIGWDIFIRMELLTSFIDYTTDNKLTEMEVIKLGQDICTALEICAKKNIIHRDIKPENIFISAFGDFKVGDFGIARELEKTSSSMSSKGTYNYIAPEVTSTKKYDATVDIYSLGLVLYKLLNNNRLPFLDPYTPQIIYKDRKDAVDRRLSGEVLLAPIEASPLMAQTILTACSYNPAMRFNTATAFRNALESVKNGMYEKPKHVINIKATTAGRRPPGLWKPNNKTDSFGRKHLIKKTLFLSGIIVFCAVGIVLSIVFATLNSHKTSNENGDDSNETSFFTFSGDDARQLHTADTKQQNDNYSTSDRHTPSFIHNTVGNTSGNIANGGRVAIQGDWVYYSFNGLHTIKTNGSSHRRLNDDQASYINVIGDWIYYCNGSDGGKLYKVRTDGSDRQVLYHANVFYVNVVGDRIFFQNISDNQKLYAVNTDGSEPQMLYDDRVFEVIVVGDRVFYGDGGNGGVLSTMKIDGSDRRILCNDIPWFIHVIDDQIYYRQGLSGGLYTINSDGSNRQRLNEIVGISHFNLYGDRIFFRNGSDDFKLYVINIDGSNKQLLSDDEVMNICVVGDRIYYNNETWELISINTDGTDRQVVS